MQSESGRYINSVSDLYGDDEIEFLLDDIRELEPISCRPDDLQGGGGGVSCHRHHRSCPHPEHTSTSPASNSNLPGNNGRAIPLHSTTELSAHTGGSLPSPSGGGGAGGLTAPSPTPTAHSWDSHAHYRRPSHPPSPDLSLYSGVIVYCDHAHLVTPTGILRLLLLVTSLACLTCLCTAGTPQVGLFMLPLVGRLRLMLFVTLLSGLVTSVLLFLDVSHTVYLFPFNWGRVNAYLYIALGLLFLIASSLLLHTVLLAEVFAWVPKWTQHQLLVTGCLGYTCTVQSVLIAVIQQCTRGGGLAGLYTPVIMTGGGRDTMAATAEELVVTSSPANYKPIINYQLALPPQSSSGTMGTTTHHYSAPYNYLDDVRPTTSTHPL